MTTLPKKITPETRLFDPNGVLAMISSPVFGRYLMRVHSAKTELTSADWVPDAAHPLGGSHQKVILHRRVNLMKDDCPPWMRGRPMYEFVRSA